MQDHIFTKSHIDKVKRYLNAEGHKDFDMGSMSGQSPSEERGRKMWEDPGGHLAQLKAMGVNSGFPMQMPGRNEII